MARYRLRFLLQEIDLAFGETLLGRSAGCHVTIEDPLVSRQHARLTVDADGTTLEDLGSRNGTLLNARPVEAPTRLSDGDRLRIGTLELVFCMAPDHPRAGLGTRPTGFLCHCAQCGTPYPTELDECPTCGARDRMDEDTLSGVSQKSNRDWTLDLVVEVLERAVTLSRWDDVERVLMRARRSIEEQLAVGRQIERRYLDMVASAASELSVARGDSEWSKWVLKLFTLLARLPRRDLVTRLAALPKSTRAELGSQLRELVENWRARGGDEEEEGGEGATVQELESLGEGGGE